jgi:hypothetical protein
MGELNGEGKLHEEAMGELHDGELDGERDEEGRLHDEGELHGVYDVQESEGGLNGKGELLHGRRYCNARERRKHQA